MLARIAEIENLINTSQQMRTRYMTIEVERVKKLVLPSTQLTHHDGAPQSIDEFQDTCESARQETFSTQSPHRRLSHADARLIAFSRTQILVEPWQSLRLISRSG
jgi:hypothetical protein